MPKTDLSSNPALRSDYKLYRGLIIVGIVVIGLCVWGVLMQLPIYLEHLEDMERYHPSAGNGAGASGNFSRALVSWNTSGAGEGQAALNTMIFLVIIAAAAVLLIVLSARRIKQIKAAVANQADDRPGAYRYTTTASQGAPRQTTRPRANRNMRVTWDSNNRLDTKAGWDQKTDWDSGTSWERAVPRNSSNRRR